uniref:Dopey_N domain-containing protein n=1 Tax=Panagrellus redivivus TaxID=6233 RepID=A0A7E4ZT10_PANRE
MSLSLNHGDQPSTSESNPKYRNFATSVDKALKLFESTTEWADLISALSKLCKTLYGAHKSISQIPRCLTVAKRLSQCLHPMLPSSVHSKALETYKALFMILMREDRLASELYVYSIGLFPLMEHCGIKVRSELLDLLEQFLFPLGPRLAPILPGLVATVLMSLDDATEFFQRSLKLLDDLMNAVGHDAFYSSLWEAVIRSPSVRLPALNYVNKKFKRNEPLGEQFSIIAGVHHVDHMIAALCCVAEDYSGPALMHRHLLDFLCAAFPLNSAHVTQADFVQILRRCLFIILRRDMSLTRRLYQWILHRSGDGEEKILPTSGTEDERDVQFFETYSLPLIKLSFVEFLKLDTIEVPTLNTVLGTTGGSYDGVREHQTHFTEVRLCRALQYFLDRPHFGQRILEEVMAIFLEYSCIQDTAIMSDLAKSCEELDSAFSPDWAARVEAVQKTSDEDRERRLDEIQKNFNALLNNLDAGFLWTFLCRLFSTLLEQNYANETDSDDQDLTDEERQARDFREQKRKEHVVLFPVMICFCLKYVQLDSHSDVRAVHLPKLLNTILTSVHKHGVDNFSRDSLVALLAVCRRLIIEITQSITAIETGVPANEDPNVTPQKSPASVRQVYASRSEHAEEQKLVEACLKSCYTLLSHVCQWYVNGRDRDKTGVLNGVTSVLRDFADFPLYYFNDAAGKPIIKAGDYGQSSLPDWLSELLKVVDVVGWYDGPVDDFKVRARMTDLLIYLYIRSMSLIEQHKAVTGRQTRRNYGSPVKGSPTSTKTTVTVLLKPMLMEADISGLDSSKLFESISRVLWRTLSVSTDAENHQEAACLLHRLHSRDSSDKSDVESTILQDLTSRDPSVASDACRRFRKLWTLTRFTGRENVYSGLPYKPFNRIIMVLLGIIADDALCNRNIPLKALATAWLMDCAKNGDLMRVLEMLGVILMNPATSRVSIQYLQLNARITRDELKSIPADVNSLVLETVKSNQMFHHVCRDVASGKPAATGGKPSTPKEPIDLCSNAAWVSDLRKLILNPAGCDGSATTNGLTPTTSTHSAVPQTPGRINTHRRTVSDIPQFDEDTESLGDVSLDSAVDPEVAEVVTFLIESVCDEMDSIEDLNERFAQAANSGDDPFTRFLPQSSSAGGSPINAKLRATKEEDEVKSNGSVASGKPDRRSLPSALPSESNASTSKPAIDRREEVTKSMIDNLGPVNTGANSTVSTVPPIKLPENIKRVKCGHRRQDSLQESIFSTTTNDLRLFDPSELPKQTVAPGDDKQPLFEEAQAHMLLYMESPNIVDLGQAESVFRILSALLRCTRGGGIGRMIVQCMVFNSTAQLPQAPSGGYCRLIEYMTRHYKSIQGESFWFENEGGTPKHCSMFELFSTLTLYYLRSYYLNSPVSPISERDLEVAWDCKMAALDFFTDLLRELITLVTETRSKELVNFMLAICRQSKLQRCLISFLLTAVPGVRDKDEPISVSADIADFNSSPHRCREFGDIAFAYHRSLLDFASMVIALEYHLHMGLHIYPEQSLVFGLQVEKSGMNKLTYNSSQNRGNLRDQRIMVVELKLFISVIVNALQRQPERHELWVQFLISILPYLDKSLPTICVHVVDYLCRNIDTCISYAYGHLGRTTFDLGAVAEEAMSLAGGNCPSISGVSFGRKSASMSQAPTNVPPESYPVNYALILLEALTTIMKFCVIEDPQPGSSGNAVMGGVVVPGGGGSSTGPYATTPVVGGGTAGSSSGASSSSVSTVVPSGLTPSVTHASTAASNASSGGGAVSSMVSMIPGSRGASELFRNFISGVFTSSESNAPGGVSKYDPKTAADVWRQAQLELLKELPEYLSTICDLWAVAQRDANPRLPIGMPEELRARVFEFVNPIAKRHPNILLNALACVWYKRAPKIPKSELDQLTFSYSESQMAIANLLLSMKVLPFQHIIYTVAECLKEFSKQSSGKGYVNDKTCLWLAVPCKLPPIITEISLLELVHGCVRLVGASDLHDCWSAFNILFAEAPLANMLQQVDPKGIFLEFKILDDFVRICGSQTIVDDKQIARSIQDACQRITDAVNTIVGWQLEPSTWLKRGLVVRQDTSSSGPTGSSANIGVSSNKSGDSTPMMETKSLAASLAPSDSVFGPGGIRGSTSSLATRDTRFSGIESQMPSSASQMMLSGSERKSSSNLRASLKDPSGTKKDPTHSTQALFLLAECLADLIDSICKSEDKEKLLPTLQSVWSNTLPYLKAKSARNARFFLASSQFLASISSFSYMRTVWRKATADLLVDNNFFKMDIHALKEWLIIVDNLISNEKTSLKEYLNRIPSSQNSSLTSLITNKEQEYEIRAQALKRIAFIVLSGQNDQYGSQLGDIQERLSDNLRLQNVPLVHAQVFANYRVMLIRMQPIAFVSLWPAMATELVQVLIQMVHQIEQLTGDPRNFI